MRLILRQAGVNIQKQVVVWLVISFGLESFVQTCFGSSLDGISLQFNKRGEKKSKSCYLYVGAKK
jgi:hypothetical protein